jgi:membrane-bound lytic murein transglycosylase D
MKRKYTIIVSMIVLGLMSCSSFHVLDPEVDAISRRGAKKNSSLHIRASIGQASGLSLENSKIRKGEEFDNKAPEAPEIILRDTPEVRKYLSLYTGRSRRDIEVPLKRRAEYLPTIEKVLNYFELPLDLSNLAFIESKFDVSARSPQGALGIWQFMKPTAQELGLRCNFWNDEREDVLRSSIAAAKYLRELQNRFDDWLLTLAAYNAGPGRVLAAIENAGGERDFYKIARLNLLPEETVNHVSKFIAVSMITRNPDLYDFHELTNVWIGDFSSDE